MQLSLVTELPHWEALEKDWRALHARQVQVSPFLSWEWMRTWWDIYGNGRSALSILVWRQADEVVGIAPFVIDRKARWPLRPKQLRVIRFLGTGEPDADSVVTEYGDILAAPGHEQAIADACALWLCTAGSSQWDVFACDNVLEDSIVRQNLIPALNSRGRPHRERLSALRYWASLPATWDEYLQTLGKNARNKLTVGRRRMEKAGRYEIETINTPDAMTAALDRLAELHKRRWLTKGHHGAFDSDLFRAFHRKIAGTLAAHDSASVSFIRLDEQDMAGVYTLSTSDTNFFYQTGFDPALAANYSPGTVVIGIDIEKTILSGRGRYDFMGSAPGSYKAHYGCTTTQMFHVFTFNRTLRGRLSLMLWEAAEAISRLRKSAPAATKEPIQETAP